MRINRLLVVSFKNIDARVVYKLWQDKDLLLKPTLCQLRLPTLIWRPCN